ncbi:MAG: metallophosphoesterase, partial [Microbacterium sp.]
VGYGVRTALGPPALDRRQITLPRLPRVMDGTRLVVVSDIHLGPLLGEGHVRRIVERINELDADVVAIVGDLVDGSVEERGADAGPLAGIRSKQGAFFVTGNHDYYSGHDAWRERLDELGIRTLRNERQELRLRGGVLDLAGVNDVTGTGYDDGPDFACTFADRDPDRPVVLMAHQPVQVHDAARYGVDLQVSGHTHGGQMAPFGWLARVEQPVVSGLGRVDGVPVYVTNGAGFWGPPVRVGAPPQVTLLELRST